MNTQKGAISILIIIVAIIALLAGTVSYFMANQNIIIDNPWQPNPNPSPNPKACTEEAKQCPDGSYVGRTGPNCEFTACPAINPPQPSPNPNPILRPNEKEIRLQVGQRAGSLLVQHIYPTYITGLNFREYPVTTNQGQPITLYIRQSASNGCDITLTLVKIDGATAIFTEKTDSHRPCPICLAENTLINTPNGQIPVQELSVGMPIWTSDIFGNKIVGTVIETSKTPVPKNHQMVHVILQDGREVLASPGHPIGDDRTFNDLVIGDTLHKSSIMVAEKIPYNQEYTYDILPSGDTGFYFANNILIDSTLRLLYNQ